MTSTCTPKIKSKGTRWTCAPKNDQHCRFCNAELTELDFRNWRPDEDPRYCTRCIPF